MPKLPALLLGLPLLVSACGTSGADQAAPSSSAAPHGYIAGAQEEPEPQTGLLTFKQDTGKAQLLSLLTEETVDAGAFGPIDAVQQEGRYAFISSDDHVNVFDTGAWTVDHGDHKHYYSSEPGPVGTINVPHAGAVAGDGAFIAVFSESEGYASIYSHKDLDAGKVVESARITASPHQGRVIPFKEHFIASLAANEGSAPTGVEVRDAQDKTVLANQSCPGLSAHAKTRAGMVLACTDGALLITEDNGTFAAEKITYPANAAGIPPAASLEHRPGSNELAAPAADGGIWHLNVSKRKWTHLKTPVPVVTASAVGDGKRVLAIGVDGSLLSVNPASGEVINRSALLAPLPETLANKPHIRIDTSRAYVSDPVGSTVREIDYADGLRAARSFKVPAADIMLEVGL